MSTRAGFTLALLGAAAVAAAEPTAGPLRVRVTPALAGCAENLTAAFTTAQRVQVQTEIVEAPGVVGADVLLADDSELTRVLEGGLGDERTAVDLGQVDWVLVGTNSRAGSLRAFAAGATNRIAVLGGIAGRAARTALGLPASRIEVLHDPRDLRSAPQALLPRTLGSGGEALVGSGIPPLTAVAVAVVGSPRTAEAAALLGFLRGAQAERLFEQCGGTPRAKLQDAHTGAAGSYAQAVVDYWLPGCSLAHNAYNDPNQVLGAPDAVNTGGKDLYRGIMSLGEGGFVVVDMGVPVIDGPGADVRVYQTTSNEPVTLYAGDAVAGPFRLVALRQSCGVRSPGLFSNHCDFDLGAAGISSARYLKIEDGELYPCLDGSTVTEGADIDAVELLPH